MKLYTYKKDFIVQEYEYWTGHIDSYFNKRFILKNIRPLIIPVDDKISNIIDEANLINYDIYHNIDRRVTIQHINKIIWKEEAYNLRYTKEQRESLNKIAITKDQILELKKMKDLVSKTYNTIYEFADETNQRSFIDIMNCQFKKFEKDIDIPIYNKLASEAQSYNILINSQIYEYLLSINAYEDYVKYHKGEQFKFQLIENSVNKILNGTD